MTRDKAINILASLAGGATQPSWEEIRKAAQFAFNVLSASSEDSIHIQFNDERTFKKEQPQGLDEAAHEHAANNGGRWLTDDIGIKCFAFNPQEEEGAFKAGAEWYDNQMKMPNSSELISAWRGVKSILQEKDFRGDEWRLAYNAFMFGFSKGLNTRTKKK